MDVNKQPDRSERVRLGRSRDELQNQPGSEQEDHLADRRSRAAVNIPFLVLMCLGPVVVMTFRYSIQSASKIPFDYAFGASAQNVMSNSESWALRDGNHTREGMSTYDNSNHYEVKNSNFNAPVRFGSPACSVWLWVNTLADTCGL